MTISGSQFLERGQHLCRFGKRTLVSASIVSSSRILCTTPSIGNPENSDVVISAKLVEISQNGGINFVTSSGTLIPNIFRFINNKVLWSGITDLSDKFNPVSFYGGQDNRIIKIKLTASFNEKLPNATVYCIFAGIFISPGMIETLSQYNQTCLRSLDVRFDPVVANSCGKHLRVC